MPQPAQPVQLQSATAPPSTTMFKHDLSEARHGAHEAAYNLDKAIHFLSSVRTVHEEKQLENEAAMFVEISHNCLATMAKTLKAAPAEDTTDRGDISRAETDMRKAETVVDRAELEMKVTDEADFTPSKFAPELRAAEADVQAAASVL